MLDEEVAIDTNITDASTMTTMTSTMVKPEACECLFVIAVVHFQPY